MSRERKSLQLSNFHVNLNESAAVMTVVNSTKTSKTPLSTMNESFQKNVNGSNKTSEKNQQFKQMIATKFIQQSS